MQIIEMIPQKNGRMKISLDDGSIFLLYKKEVSACNLREGEELSEELWIRIRTEILDQRAKKRAMHLLEKMDRTEYQLRQKLKESGYPQESIDTAIAYVKSFHYVDDERYASAYIRCHQNSKSRLQLKYGLQQRGIAASVIDRVLAEEYGGGEEELILRLLEKKHYDAETMDQKEKYKIYQYLMRRGFPGGLVRKCMML